MNLLTFKDCILAGLFGFACSLPFDGIWQTLVISIMGGLISVIITAVGRLGKLMIADLRLEIMKAVLEEVMKKHKESHS